MAGRKFYASTSTTILLSVAAFILLSGCINADSARKCYWCGPLAEQVHRSQRAPPCDAPKAHVTACDAGFQHCAIVATAPPYVESRYCVKIYQDECYLDFCNTTKTWKMTCPCKGDLCNGQNSDREEEAFAELIAKTQRIVKKRTKKSIKEPLVKSIQTDAKEIASISSNLSVIEINNQNKTPLNENESVTEIHIYETPLLTSNSPHKDQSNEERVTTVSTVEKTTTVNVADENTDKNMEKDTALKETMETSTTQYVLESTAIKIGDNLAMPLTENLIKPSEQLPTAEALQQTGTSEDVNSDEEEQSTISDEPSTTIIETVEITTEQPTSRKNEAINKTINFNLLLVLFFSLSQF